MRRCSESVEVASQYKSANMYSKHVQSPKRDEVMTIYEIVIITV